MKSLILVTALFSFPAAAQPSLTLVPDVITNCTTSGLGRTQIFWNVPGANSVQLRAGGADGNIMGVEPGQGRTETGDWVRNGMVFALTTADGQQLATATARVACQAPTAGSYFPLDVGDEWVYRVDSRFGTAQYQTRRVDGAEIINGTVYFAVSSGIGGAAATEMRYRVDGQDRVYSLSAANAEQLLLDPSGASPGALYKVLTNSGNTLSYDRSTGLIDELGTFTRGVGFVSSSSRLLTGSSGGFLEGYNLIYARIAGNVVFGAPAAGLELTVESRDLDLSGGHVTNCAIPCYYVACGLGSPVDPPGTYKPCFQARARLQETPASFDAADAQSRTVLFDLLDSSGAVVSSANDSVLIGPGQLEAVVAHSIMLPMTPGAYRLRARVLDASHIETDSASLSVRIR